MIIDISQELFSCRVFPGDSQPVMKRPQSIKNGDICNLTELSMCAHNGTHVDAPYHFIDDGDRIDNLPLDRFVGISYVAEHSGEVSAEDAERIMQKAEQLNASEKILIAGDAVVTKEAAEVFVRHNVRLVGNESQTVGPVDAPAAVHYVLLGSGAVLLEGVNLSSVKEGRYFLSAAPLNLGGCDGAPCRAYLMTIDD